MADYVFSAPLSGSTIESLLQRVLNNQDFTTAQRDKLAELQNLYYTQEVSFVSTATQAGVLDTPSNVLYGPLVTSPNSLVRHNLDGTLDILGTGPYLFKSRHRVARTGASGVSKVFFWIEISNNGGSSWTVLGNSVDVQLSSPEDEALFFDSSALFLTAGTKIRARFARSSTGTDAGSLVPSTPSAALTSAGVPVSPSAQLTIYRSENWEY